MTAAQQSTAKGGGKASAQTPPGAAPHAYVENGTLYVMEGGRYRAFSREEAFWLWFRADSSPFASTQERARQIRAAMDEAFPQSNLNQIKEASYGHAH